MHGLYLLWWVQEKQMSPAIVAAMLAAGDLALIGLELPTGWFADRFGHRASLIIGSFVQILGMGWCWFGQGVPGLLTASVLVALGDAFRSGANQALLYRTCLALDREHDFQRIEAKTEAIALVALVVLVLMGGVIVQAEGFAGGWLAEVILCSVGLVIACGMVEPPAQSNGTIEQRAAKEATTIPYKRLAALIMPAALLGGAASAASFLAQTVGTYSPAEVTLLVAALTAAEAGGSALVSRLPLATLRDQVKVTALGGIFVITAIAWPPSLPVGAVILGFLLGIAQPLRAAAIQRLASDDIRARAASAASACDMAISVLVLPLAGLGRSRRT
ncbi:MAG: MFS transporter [Vicinamibacterales bacterium]